MAGLGLEGSGKDLLAPLLDRFARVRLHVGEVAVEADVVQPHGEADDGEADGAGDEGDCELVGGDIFHARDAVMGKAFCLQLVAGGMDGKRRAEKPEDGKHEADGGPAPGAGKLHGVVPSRGQERPFRLVPPPVHRAPHHFETRLFLLPGEANVLRAQVADFYRAKGYQVRENPRVRGHSESIYAVEMVAEGPLGALLISFGDAGGVDAAEISRVRTLARDIGATPVIAAQELSPDLRRMAAQFAVVVLDQATLAQPDDLLPAAAVPRDLRRDLDAHPWPESGRARPEETGAHMDPQDVDDLLSQLGSSKPVGRARTDGGGLWKRSAIGVAPSAPASPPASVAVPPAAPLTPPAVPPTHPAPTARPTATAKPAAPFGWLASSRPDVAVVEPTRPTVDDVLPPAPMPAPRPRLHVTNVPADDAADVPLTHGPPLLSHEATLQTRRATIAEKAGDLRTAVEDRVAPRMGLLRFGLIVGGGALLLFFLIRWFT